MYPLNTVLEEAGEPELFLRAGSQREPVRRTPTK